MLPETQPPSTLTDTALRRGFIPAEIVTAIVTGLIGVACVALIAISMLL